MIQPFLYGISPANSFTAFAAFFIMLFSSRYSIPSGVILKFAVFFIIVVPLSGRTTTIPSIFKTFIKIFQQFVSKYKIIVLRHAYTTFRFLIL